jgi:hypothetical protein
MLDNNNAVFKAKNEPFRKEEFQIVLGSPYHFLNPLRVVYKTIIIRPHVQVKVQALR